MDDLMQFLPIVLACVVVPMCILFWLLALERTTCGVPLLDWSARRPVPWTIGDLLLLMLVGITITWAAQILVAHWFGVPLDTLKLTNLPLQPEHQVALLTGFSIGTILMWCFSLLWLSWRAGASREDLGWPRGPWAYDLTLGLVAFIMLVVPVLAVHFLLQQIWRTEATHPFIEIVVRDPRPLFLIPVIVAGVCVAPVVEEFLFRVYLQGWLERLPSPWAWWRGRKDRTELPQPSTAVENSPEWVVQAEPVSEATDTTDHMPSAWWPVGVSGLLFSTAHVGQGPAPVSLFFLGLGLGYLYHRTHRVLPCIVVHFLVNLTAVIQLALYVAQHNTAE